VLKLLADPNIAFVDPLFRRFGELRLLPGRDWTPADVRDRDVLLVRSVTRVDERLLAGSAVRFVATATSGTEHVDRAWLAGRGIGFADAAGSNAVAVAEYVLSAIAVYAGRAGRPLPELSLGIIGRGHCGGALAARAAALGLRCVVNDPPLARREPDAAPNTLEAALGCDVVSLHVPLTTGGPHPTAGLIDGPRLGRLAAGACLVNAARGAVVDEAALLERLRAGPELFAVIDCWQAEPAISAGLLAAAGLGTPHIAGYSADARARGTWMLYRALAEWFGFECRWPEENLRLLYPPPPVLAAGPGEEAEILQRLILDCYDARADAAALAGAARLAEHERGALFDRLRRGYPLRREFGARRLSRSGLGPRVCEQARALGIQLAD